jgi:octopine/nopaline transport system permease protein
MELLSFGDAGWSDELLRAALVTLAVSLCALALGIVIGSLGAAAKLSRIAPARWLAELYTTVVRGVPELLVIYLLFFGGSGAVMFFARLFGHDGYIELNAFLTGTIAVGLICGAYATEVIRGAVLAVPRGQIEAALAIGMGRWLLRRRILLPQVARYALPGLGNVWMETLKGTSLISVTGLVELMRQSFIAAGSTREPFLFYTVAAVLYLALTTLSGWGLQRAEAWASRGERRAA